MKIIEALKNTLTFLESLGYKSGDVHDDLARSMDALVNVYPRAAHEYLPEPEADERYEPRHNKPAVKR